MEQKPVIPNVTIKRVEIDPMLTRKQVSEYLQVTLNTVDRMVKEGVPSVMIYSMRRFRKEEVDKWIKARQKQPYYRKKFTVV